TIEHDAGRFEAATIERMLGHWLTLLAGLVEAPETPTGDLPLLTSGERAQLLIEWSGGAAPYPREATIAQLFAQQAARRPEVPALAWDGGTLTYAELDGRANRLANHLRRLGVGLESRIGLLLERSPELIVAMLAVLKAGGAYVPLDPEHPQDRLALLVEDTGLAVVIGDDAPLARLRALPHLTRVAMGADGAAIARESDAAPEIQATADSLAYVLYTSGSTGRPKGVLVPHRAVVRLVRSGDGFARFRDGEVFLQLAPAAFDAATFEIWGALLSGACLALYPRGLVALGELAATVARHRVTTLWLTAGLFHLVAEDEPALFGSLACLLAGGDVLQPEAVRRALAALPAGATLVNGYGPTENTTFTCCHVLRGGDELNGAVPIGRPIANTSVHLLDRALQPVPAGVPGELCAGGDGLARGYQGRPDLTAERFVPSPFGVGERLYRTGDLVRHRTAGGGPDGVIEFLGRLDQQVKVRGFRVEPGEVEAVLARHAAVKAAAVVTKAGGAAGRALVAFVVLAPGGDATMDELRAYLAEHLPEPLVPASLLPVAQLPLTANGKVDRKALARTAAQAAAPERETAAPASAVEARLVALWAEVLGVARVGVHDSFFHLGGHSLLATQLISRVRAALGVDLPLSDLFAWPTPAALALRVEEARKRKAVAASPLVAQDRTGPLPLSFAQRRLWFLAQLEPESAAYHVAGALRLRGALDGAALHGALAEIVRRHEALRTVFQPGAGEPEQRVVAPPAVWPLPVVDLAVLPESARADEAERLAAAEAVRRFHLAAGPLLRTLLLAFGGDEHRLVVTLHHIAADGWSMGVMTAELQALYAAALRGSPSPRPAGSAGIGGSSGLAPLTVQYGDFALWQRRELAGGALERDLSYWRRELADLPALDLPADRSRPLEPSGRGGSVPVALPASLADDLSAVAYAGESTLYMTLLAGFAALLFRYTAQEDFAVGSPVANRDRPEIEPLLGCFITTLALRVKPRADLPFARLLSLVRATTLAAYDHPSVPFERLVEELQPERDRARTPLFQVLLVLQNAPHPSLRELALPGLEIAPEAVATGTAKFDLNLALEAVPEGIAGTLEHSADLFEKETAERFARHLVTLLSDAAKSPERPLAALPLLAAAEWDEIVHGFGSPEAPAAAPAGLLHECVAVQAARTPHAPAVRGDDGSLLTYAELASRAGALARHLRRLGVGPEVRVAVCQERTPDLVVSLLGVLAAGGAYVPLDPAYPDKRLHFLLRDSGAAVLVADRAHSGRFSGSSHSPIPVRGPGVRERGTERVRALPVVLTSDVPASATASAWPRSAVLPENLAYLIYTSGSTGTPKAVAIEHRSAVATVGWALQAYGAVELRGVLAATSIAFDLSVFEIFVPLAAGGQVIVAENALALARHPAASEVTLLNTVPSAGAELARAGLPPSVVTVNLAGEPLPGALADRLYAQPSVRRVANLYGPSEDTTYSTWADVPRERSAEPTIGRPIAGGRAYVLDAALQPVPIGVTGELYLGGAGLARGYLGRPELTAERFVPAPFAATPGERLYRTGDLARF
ncbi:MAG TPA: amino acid adenylation domain-containing protein, partial [Thermoanaerobaculia bacterium]